MRTILRASGQVLSFATLFLALPVMADRKSDKPVQRPAVFSTAALPQYRDFNDELKQRFATAMRFSLQAQRQDEALLRLLALRLIHYEFGVDIGLERLIEIAARSRPDVKEFFLSKNQSGLAARDPIHAVYEDPKPEIQIYDQKITLEKPSLAEVLRMGTRLQFFYKATASCLSTEMEYNRRFVKEVENEIPLKKYPGVALSVASRLWQNGCLSADDFQKAGVRSAPAILTFIKQNKGMPQPEMIFLLVSAGGLDLIPADTLVAFVRSQDVSGAWRPDTKDPSASAATGAYVVARMMQKSGLKVETELFEMKPMTPKGASDRGTQ